MPNNWLTADNMTSFRGLKEDSRKTGRRQEDECPLAFQRIGNKCYFYGYFKVIFEGFLIASKAGIVAKYQKGLSNEHFEDFQAIRALQEF